MIRDPINLDLARYQREQDRTEAAEIAAELRAERIAERAKELLADPEFIWDFLGDVDRYGVGVRDYAVKAAAQAVMAAMQSNPALAYCYRELASKEAKRQIEKEEKED